MSRRDPYVFNPASSPESDGAKVFWRSLESKADPVSAQKRAEKEFPDGLDEAKASSLAAAEKKDLVSLRRAKDQPVAIGSDSSVGKASLSRRGFMFFAGATTALAAEGCARRPVEKLLPYSKSPEQIIPGVPVHFATVRSYRGDAIGLLVESHEGHPTKIEGNPDHPSSKGKTDALAQGEIYELYDPDRATAPQRAKRAAGGLGERTAATWTEADAALGDLARTAQSDGGAKLRFLAPPTTSPTFVRLRGAILARYPNAKFHTWTAVSESNTREGAKLAFGRPVNVVPALDKAKVIVSLDSDFLGTEPGNVRAALGFAQGRKLREGTTEMNRLYVVEPSFTVTGMNADHRLRLPASQVERYALALAKELAEKHGVELGPVKAAVAKADVTGIDPKWLSVVAKELVEKRAKGAILVGSRQPARVHALAHALNASLGNATQTIEYFDVLDATEVDAVTSLKALADDIAKGSVGTLVVLGGNPVYDAPADLKLDEKIRSVGSTVYLSSHQENETTAACAWSLPAAHFLEAWGDARALDGTVSVQQPLIAPLHGGRSDIEILARFTGESAPKGYELVQTTMRGSISSPGSFTRIWNDALKKGVAGPSSAPFGAPDALRAEVATALASAKPAAAPTQDALELVFAVDPKLVDGRYANNPQLLELPDPVTKVTWDNVALISPKTAAALGLENRQLVRLTREGAGAGTVDIAVWITPGQAENVLTVNLGWGRQKAGRYGDRHGFDVGPLRTTDALWFAAGVKLQKLGTAEAAALLPKLRKVGMAAADSPVAGRVRPDEPFEVGTSLYKVSQTQEHGGMEGRPIAIDATFDEYKKQPFFPMFPEPEDGRKDVNKDGEVIRVRESGSPDPTTNPLWTSVDYSKGHKWGMAVDLSACTGCNACVVACQIENNVPAVGKEMIERGREMYWMRIDRYFVGLDADNPQIAFQPVACVHCEEAPCENVCPVNATVHSPEGTNDMAYNRCIGTRYCANNCPYKVRRFNFLNYHSSGGAYMDVPEVERMRFNPDVTVRIRGVMEKCTYCIQRIQEGKIASKRTGKPIKDGDIVSACQQACPSDAIVFGDLNDPESRVAKWRATDRSYRLLAEIGTHPRTSYLGKIRNPHPDMEKDSKSVKAG
jgi:Fe-S-cluster-containing dehydrogenase component/anaerobic selenocysteine-containing dehydrogenase